MKMPDGVAARAARVALCWWAWAGSPPAVLSQPTPAEACTRGALELTIRPSTQRAVEAHTTVTYEVLVRSGDTAPCAERPLFFVPDRPLAAIASHVTPPLTLLAPGRSARFVVALTGTSEAAPGVYELPFRVNDSVTPRTASGRLRYVLRPAHGCFVDPRRELVIRDPTVVDDPVRSAFSAPARDPRRGAWTFGNLMRSLAPTPDQAPALAERLFETWLDEQPVNGARVAARPALAGALLDGWPRSADGALDLARSPLRLLAIVNRIDLAALHGGHAGEGRFVFGVVNPDGSSNPFTIILEYRLHAASESDLQEWAQAWHALGALPFPSERYNAALQAITDRFSAARSALSALRSNEIMLDVPWELRSFALAPAADRFVPMAVELTPALQFLGSQLLADFINANAGPVLAGAHQVPLQLEGRPFLAGSALNNFQVWDAPAVAPAARRAFALHTCSGCHGIETGTEFVHIAPREPGARAELSGFLLGTAVSDPVTGEVSVINELARRKRELEALVCHGRAVSRSPHAGAGHPSRPRADWPGRHGGGRLEHPVVR